MKRLKVLYTIPDMTLGGSQRLLSELALELEKSGVDGRVVVLRDESRVHPDYAFPGESPAFLNYSGNYFNLKETRACVGRLRSLIQEEKPDVVHSFLWTADLVTSLALTKLPKVAYVSYILDARPWMQSKRWKHRFRRWFTRRSFRKTNARFVAVSQAAKNHFCQYLPYESDRATLAYNGIKAEEFGTPTRTKVGEETVFGIVGRLVAEKGHAYLLRAAAVLKKRGLAFRVKIAGQGELREELEALARELGIEGEVEFLGAVDDVRSFYQELDVFVVPSINSEGLPTTILEAMATRLPVIATDIGGAAEAIDSGKNGLVIKSHDSERLAEVMIQFASDRARLQAFGDAARQTVEERFTLQQMANSVLEQYQTALRDLS